MKQERIVCELMECMRKAAEMRINEIAAKMEKTLETERETEDMRKIKALIGLRVFITNKDMEYCEAARIEEAIYTEQGTLLKLKTTTGRRELRAIEELKQTIFFTREKALAALKVDEDGNPINTYLTEFIKRFPEYKGREKEIPDNVCRLQVFELQGCQDYIEDRTPADCQACWNRPYKKAEQ